MKQIIDTIYAPIRRAFPELDNWLNSEDERTQRLLLKHRQTYFELQQLRGTVTPEEFEIECRRRIDLEELLVCTPMQTGEKSASAKQVDQRKIALRRTLQSCLKTCGKDPNHATVKQVLSKMFGYQLDQPDLGRMVTTQAGNCVAFSKIALMTLRETHPETRVFIEVLHPESGTGHGHQRLIIELPEHKGRFFTFDPLSEEFKELDYRPTLEDPPEYVLLEAFLDNQERDEEVFKRNPFNITKGIVLTDELPTEQEIHDYLTRCEPFPRPPAISSYQRFKKTLKTPLQVAIIMLGTADLVDITVNMLPSAQADVITTSVEPPRERVIIFNPEIDTPEQTADQPPTSSPQTSLNSEMTEAEAVQILKEAIIELIEETQSETHTHLTEYIENVPFIMRTLLQTYNNHNINKLTNRLASIRANIDEHSVEQLREKLDASIQSKNIITDKKSAYIFSSVKYSFLCLWAFAITFILRSRTRANKLPIVN